MAITFSKALSESNLLNAYNNNIIEFSSDNVLNSVKCVITIDSIPFEISPINNVFRFNFKEIISILINSNQFVDAITPEIISGDLTSHIYNDTSNTYWSQSIGFEITFSDTSTESTSKTYKFLKSVEQVEDYLSGVVLGDEAIRILAPLKAGTTNTYSLTYFEGHPFDISIYLQTAGVTNILNQTNGLDVDLNLSNTINRVVFSDGVSDITLADYLPLVDGLNKLKITRGADVVYLNLTKIDASNGNFIKWHNSQGGWSYWLFNCIHKRERMTKDLGDVNNDFNNVAESNDSFYELGKESQDKLTLITERVDADAKKLFNELVESPKVYYFAGLRYSLYAQNRWIACKMLSSKIAVVDYKTKLFKYKLDFELPKRNTMTL